MPGVAVESLELELVLLGVADLRAVVEPSREGIGVIFRRAALAELLAVVHELVEVQLLEALGTWQADLW